MTWTYYTIGRFGWSESLIGISLTLVGLCMAAMQLAVLPRAVAKWGERKTATIGIVGASVAMIGYVFANEAWMAWVLLPLMACQSLVHPNLTSMMTRRASASTQGEVQGFASAIMAIGALVAPITFNPLLAWFTGPSAPFVFHGAAFVLAALFGLACIPILVGMRRAQPEPAESKP
jgi:DHA1 family tetracycline resistance protein-like MFS transporter